MALSRWSILLCAAALACTPKLNGTCAGNADCHPGETCSAAGLCLRPGAATGDGDADGNDAGLATTATIDILSPAASAILRGTFHVAALTGSAIAIQDVTFHLTNASSGSALGQLVVAAPAANHWSGDLTLDAATFGGGADLVAVMHRTGLTDVSSAKVSIVVDQNAPSISPAWSAARWWALDAGISLVANVSDDRSGVASATLLLPDGGTVSGVLGAGTATFNLPATAVGSPGTALKVPVGLAATDVAGNPTLLTAASTIAVDDQPPSISLVALDPAVWRNGLLEVDANVSDGTGSGLNGTSLLLNGAFTPGSPDGGGGFSYRVDLSKLPATEAAVGLQVVGVDLVGNQADAGFNLNVDNVPPLLTSASIDTGPDVKDASGRGWYQGPTVLPGGSDILVSAVVTDTNLNITSLAPSAVVGASSYPGTLSAGRWHFAIPRSVGLKASGAVTIGFDAQDLAGNHPVSSPSLSLYFDDQKALALTVTSDSTIRGPSQTATIGVQTAAPSGFPLSAGAVNLAAAAQLTLGNCSGANAIPAGASSSIAAFPASSTFVFKVPVGTCAPGNTDGAVPFSVVVNSLAGGSGSGTGTTLVDTRGPVIGNLSIFYPSDPGPLGWSHDGTNFHRRDSGDLFAFSTYDCHGLGGVPRISGLGPGVSIAEARDTSGTLIPASTCASPGGVNVYRYTVSLDLANLPTSSLPAADNNLGWTAFASDVFGNQSSLISSIKVTRRLWRDAPPTPVSFLTLATRLFASARKNTMYSYDPSNGSRGSWTSSSDMPVIAPNGGSAALVYLASNSIYAGDTAAPTTSTFGSCSGGAVLDGFSLLDASTALFESHTDQTTCLPGCADCGGRACCSLCYKPTLYYKDQLHLSGRSVTCGATSTATTLNCTGSTSGNTAYAYRVYSANPANYIGLNANAWSLVNPGGTLVDATPANVVNAPGWPLIDGSSPPLVYLPGLGTPGNVELRVVNASSFGTAPFSLPAFPGSITDLLLAKNGILYVLSSNLVHAVLTDSAGGATAAGGNQASGWPSQCRDPCRSSNAGIQCPY